MLLKITEKEWNIEGERLFGKDRMDWRFQCPLCKMEWSVKDWKEAGASPNEVAFSCVGRHKENGCDYAGGGLFKLNPLTVVYEDGEETRVFNFAAVS